MDALTLTSPTSRHRTLTVAAGIALIAGLLVFCFGGAAWAQPYDHGSGALQIFDAEGQANAPRWVRIWILIMASTFALGLIFVWWRVEARWAVGGMIALLLSFVVIRQFTDIAFLSGLIALLHLVFWSPALYLLLTRRPFLKERSIYAVWSGAMAFVILFSFVFDIRDAAIYVDHITGLGLLS